MRIIDPARAKNGTPYAVLDSPWGTPVVIDHPRQGL